MGKYKVIIYPDGDRGSMLNGKTHREDGPAVIFFDGDIWWYLSGHRHREDGPAVEYVNGYKCWYLNGEKLTKWQYDKRMSSG